MFFWKKRNKMDENLYLNEYRDGDWVVVMKDNKYYVGHLFKAIDNTWNVTVYDGGGSFLAKDKIVRLATEAEKQNLSQPLPNLQEIS